MGCSGSKNTGSAVAAPVENPQPIEGDFKITLERTSAEQTLGLGVVNEDSVLRVERVGEEGLVPDFIKAHESSPDQHVKLGDLIVAVNGISAGAEKVMGELNANTIVLTIKRAPPAEPPAPTEGEAVAAAPAENVEPAAEPEAASAEPAAVPDGAVEPVLGSKEGASPPPEPAQDETEVEVEVVQGEQEVQAENAEEARLCKMSIC